MGRRKILYRPCGLCRRSDSFGLGIEKERHSRKVKEAVVNVDIYLQVYILLYSVLPTRPGVRTNVNVGCAVFGGWWVDAKGVTMAFLGPLFDTKT